MEFLKKALFPLWGEHNFRVWHLLVVLAIAIAVVLIVVIAVLSRRKSNKPDKSSDSVDGKPVAEDSQISDEQNAEQSSDQTVKETADDDVVVTEEVDDEPDADEEPATEEEAAQEEKEAADRKRPKNYHISLRADGKWQVKLSKGAKPLKLFDTQAQAIAFAKEKARNQEGTITIHKVNGQIRKQKY